MIDWIDLADTEIKCVKSVFASCSKYVVRDWIGREKDVRDQKNLTLKNVFSLIISNLCFMLLFF